MKNKIRKIWACIKSYWQECFCDYRTFWIVFIFVLLIVAMLCFVFYSDWINYHYNEHWGQFGDTLGGSTAPIIGLFSVILLVVTLNEQIKFNKEQKRQAFDEQFKSTLFNLLETQRNIKYNISGRINFLNSNILMEIPLKSNNDELENRGDEYFSKMIYLLRFVFYALEDASYYHNYDSRELAGILESIQSQLYTGANLPPELEEENRELLKSVKQPSLLAYINDKFKIRREDHERYRTLCTKSKISMGYYFLYINYENVGGYFRHLYHILKFIDQTKKDEVRRFYGGKETEEVTNKYMDYAQFIQAQMSFDELLLLFYDSFLFEKLQKLLLDYNLLENLYIERLIYPSHAEVEGFKFKSIDFLYNNIYKR